MKENFSVLYSFLGCNEKAQVFRWGNETSQLSSMFNHELFSNGFPAVATPNRLNLPAPGISFS